MNVLFIFIFSSFISLSYNYAIHLLEYRIPLETLRLRRIKQYGIWKITLKHKIEKLNNRVFKKEKQKARAFKKIEKMKNRVKQINIDLLYLENYGEKS